MRALSSRTFEQRPTILANQLLRMLLDRSYQRREFKLANGASSDFWLDLGETILTAEGGYIASEVLLSMIDTCPNGNIIAVAGCESIGTAMAAQIAHMTYSMEPVRQRIDAISLTRESKTKWAVRGDSRLMPGHRVVLVTDAVSTGKSTVGCIKRLREAGYEIPLVCALVDRQEGGRAQIEALEIPLMTAFNRSDFIGSAR